MTGYAFRGSEKRRAECTHGRRSEERSGARGPPPAGAAPEGNAEVRGGRAVSATEDVGDCVRGHADQRQLEAGDLGGVVVRHGQNIERIFGPWQRCLRIRDRMSHGARK
ncbi:hypothetical protein GCM10010219_23410 [Streptomyces netropsis]|nr:hypothetical protein GCM10010219_23410 [Streptomyces netropsis]